MLIPIGVFTEPQRGVRVQEFFQDYCVIDLETTGYNAGWDSIIELCAMRVRNGAISDKFVSLINPNFPIPSFIENLTGISTDMVSSAPALEEVLSKYIDFIGDDIVLGHNVTFDLNFLTFETARILGHSFINNYMDTLSLSRKVFPNTTNHRLATLAEELSLSSPAHRSEADCITTKELYDLIYKTAKENQIDPFSKNSSSSHLRAADITASTNNFDEASPFYQKICVFTGALSFPRRKAMQMVADIGGINGDSVTKATDFLIVGNTDYVPNLKGTKSNKLKKAEALIAEGQDIKVLTEQTFLKLIESNSDEQSDTHGRTT